MFDVCLLLLNLLTNIIEALPYEQEYPSNSGNAIDIGFCRSTDLNIVEKYPKDASICSGESFGELLIHIILSESAEFMETIHATEESSSQSTDAVVELASHDLDTIRESDPISIEGLALSAHAALLLYLVYKRQTNNKHKPKVDVASRLPKNSWWLPLRLLSGFLALHGKVCVVIIICL